MAAIVGAGLLPTMAAVKTGKRVLLANKALVMSGQLLLMRLSSMAKLVLSILEHNAIFQCFQSKFKPV